MSALAETTLIWAKHEKNYGTLHLVQKISRKYPASDAKHRQKIPCIWGKA
jgi:hypothetical protein